MADINESLNLLLDIENPNEKISAHVETSELLTETVQTQIKTTADVKKNKSKYTLSDAEFLRNELKFSIQSASMMLEVLSQDLKVGSAPRAFECYGNLLKAKNEAIKELKDLNVSETNFEVKEDEIKKGYQKLLPVNQLIQNNLNIASGQIGQGNTPIPQNLLNPDTLRQALLQARESSELLEVEASYEVEDSPVHN